MLPIEQRPDQILNEQTEQLKKARAAVVAVAELVGFEPETHRIDEALKGINDEMAARRARSAKK